MMVAQKGSPEQRSEVANPLLVCWREDGDVGETSNEGKETTDSSLCYKRIIQARGGGSPKDSSIIPFPPDLGFSYLKVIKTKQYFQFACVRSMG